MSRSSRSWESRSVNEATFPGLEFGELVLLRLGATVRMFAYKFPASALPISLEEDDRARAMRRTLNGADAAFARLIVRIGPAGMIGHIQHLGDARGHPPDFRCHPLF